MEPTPTPAFAWIDTSWGRVLRCLPLHDVAPHLFTTRGTDLRGPDASAGWARVAAALDVAPSRVVRLKQVHGVQALVIRAGDKVAVASEEEGLPRADAALTDDPSTAVAIQVADCAPLLVADRATGAVAAVHAGWRGTASGIAARAVETMSRVFGSRASDLVAAIGPAIGPCCYQVGADVLAAFRALGASEAQADAWFRPEHDGDRFLLDVPGANRDLLIGVGLAAANVHLSGLCTRCHPALFHSYRRDGAGTGRLAGAIRPARRGCASA